MTYTSEKRYLPTWNGRDCATQNGIRSFNLKWWNNCLTYHHAQRMYFKYHVNSDSKRIRKYSNNPIDSQAKWKCQHGEYRFNIKHPLSTSFTMHQLSMSNLGLLHLRNGPFDARMAFPNWDPFLPSFVASEPTRWPVTVGSEPQLPQLLRFVKQNTVHIIYIYIYIYLIHTIAASNWMNNIVRFE